MSGLLLAANEPPRFSAPYTNSRPASRPKVRLFASEAERFAWLGAEYRRLVKPGLRKGIGISLTLEAFGVTLDDLNRPGTQPRIRAKVMCTALILSGSSYADIAAKFGVGRPAVCQACQRNRARIIALLGIEESAL